MQESGATLTLGPGEALALASACVDALGAVRLGSEALAEFVKRCAGTADGQRLELFALGHVAAQLALQVFLEVASITLRPGEAVTADGAVALRSAAAQMVGAMLTAMSYRGVLALGEPGDDISKQCAVADAALLSALQHVGMKADLVRQ